MQDLSAFFLANRAALVGAMTADLGLDLVERGNALECLAGDRRGASSGEFEEAAAYVRPAERE